ncbi:type IV conjugative transfer system protein TraL [Photobacterium damselae subsp. damselae]|uniref:Type IV conjugative transfer system protein TraL n=1 Tax=Photobacterium damselae subsp. damselae TaxID=85581 RepID=A0A850R0N1_PHODD|nr:type IV conjugative transfer system protein TraL [Photobacterium damselae subsp. damselae]
MNEEIDIPDLCDEPIHFLLWQWDQALPVSVGLMIGIVIGYALFGLILGFGLVRIYTKTKDSKPKGYFFHILYDKGLFITQDKIKSMPNALIDEFHS